MFCYWNGSSGSLFCFTNVEAAPGHVSKYTVVLQQPNVSVPQVPQEKMTTLWTKISMFTLGLNTAKSTDYIEKFFNQKLSKIIFLQKSHGVHLSILLTSGARELQRFVIPIPVHYILKMANPWRPLAQLMGEIDICSHPVRFLQKI